MLALVGVDKNGSCFNELGLNFMTVQLEPQNDGIRPYPCSECNRSYGTQTGLKRHMARHSKVLVFECEECADVFNNSSDFASHKSSHSEDRVYPCQYCHKKFSAKYVAARHEKAHPESGNKQERTEICEDCGASFADPRNLKKHSMIHTGLRPYFCRTCGKSFGSSSSCNMHERSHTGERPFACDYCPKRFVCKSHLTTHLRIHMGVKPYYCEPCNRRFSDPSSFRRHLRSHPYNVENNGTDLPPPAPRGPPVTKRGRPSKATISVIMNLSPKEKETFGKSHVKCNSTSVKAGP